MFSVLIPCYNQDVTRLLRDLSDEIGTLDIDCEVRCYDDGSEDQWKEINSIVADLPYVTYVELTHNLGRSAIRQKLASDAQYDKLIFLDGDSGITCYGLLAQYLKYTDRPLVSGGRIYPTEKMSAPYILHWTYGRERESVSLAQRQRAPITYFHSNNFMIDKALFLETGFDQGLQGYGYEDILFANRLEDQGVPILHIDNAIVHLQLDKTDDFLSKTRNAVANLKKLNAAGISLATRLEKAASMLNTIGLSRLAAKFLSWREPAILRNLRSDEPRMRLMDYYKLLHYLEA
jgi:glycosyltransferase involved in cell wall biosynthesis